MPNVFERLNLDVICALTCYLNFEDIVSLGLTCRTLQNWVHEEVVSRPLVETSIRLSREAALARRGAIGYGEAAERVYKRRNAVAAASPYSCDTVGFGRSFCYKQGVVCYLDKDNLVRILDLLETSDAEIVVDLYALLHAQFPGSLSKLRIISFHDHVAVISLQNRDQSGASDWLLALKLSYTAGSGSAKVLLFEELETTHKLFVRQSSDLLVYGVFRQSPYQKRREWLIVSRTLPANGDAPQLCIRTFGSDVDANVAFRIHRGYFYAVSTSPSSDYEDKEWVSMYQCLRFPLENPSICPRSGLIEPGLLRLYRRQHLEGPIHDLWTGLSLQEDERTGQLMILESRREWMHTRGQQQRSCYIQPLQFDACEPQPPDWPQPPPPAEHQNPDCERFGAEHEPAGAEPEPGGEHRTPLFELSPGSIIHRDSSTAALRLSRSKYRSYSLAARAFVDLVETEPELGQAPAGGMLLRISAAREYATPSQTPDAVQGASTPEPAVLWLPDSVGARVQYIKHPAAAGGSQHVTVAADERAIVYMVGAAKSKRKALVVVNFDPGIQLGRRAASVDHGDRMDLDQQPCQEGASCVRLEAAMHTRI